LTFLIEQLQRVPTKVALDINNSKEGWKAAITEAAKTAGIAAFRHAFALAPLERERISATTLRYVRGLFTDGDDQFLIPYMKNFASDQKMQPCGEMITLFGLEGTTQVPCPMYRADPWCHGHNSWHYKPPPEKSGSGGCSIL